YWTFQRCMTGPNISIQGMCEGYDYDDGDVDLQDFARFQNEFSLDW
ncbi:unnamed protein product, partial [marine sediment metagenome]